MITNEMGGHRFPAGIASTQRDDFYASNDGKNSLTFQDIGNFFNAILGESQKDVADPVGEEVATAPSSQNFGVNSVASQVLGGDAPMDRATSCQVPDKPLDPSLLDRLMEIFSSLFSNATADENCPEPQIAAEAPAKTTVKETAAEPGLFTALNMEENQEVVSVAPVPYQDIIQRASVAHDVDEVLIRSVIAEESSFNPTARSHAGAMGLMQLMPRTARELGVQKPYNPEQNIMGGTLYLGRLLDRYNGDVKMALTAYNWGPGNLEQHPNKIPKSVQKYVAKVVARLDNDGLAASG